MADETISEKCETLYHKLNSFVTSVINRDVTPQINNLESGKANIGHFHDSYQVLERNALSNIGTSVNALQFEVNEAVDEKVGSLSTSIANLIKVQAINTGTASCGSLYSIDRTATVTACPTGYSVLFIPQNGYRSVTRFASLNGTTATFHVTNISNTTQDVNARGWLVYYPSTWNI